MTVRRGRRRKQLLGDLREKRGYWKLKEEALDRPPWRTRFGRFYGPVVRIWNESVAPGYKPARLVPLSWILVCPSFPWSTYVSFAVRAIFIQ